MRRLDSTMRFMAIFAATLLVAGSAAASPSAQKVPASVRWLLNDVSRLIDARQYDEAIGKLLAFQAKGDPTDPEDDHHHAMVYLALGNGRLLSGQPEPAEKDLAEATRRQPDMVPAWLNRAKACCELGRHAAAAQYFTEAYERATEKQPDYLYYAAAALLIAQEYHRSIAVFERLLAGHPDAIKPEWQAHWAHALMAGGQSRRALPVIQKLIATHTGEERVRWQETLLYQYIQLSMLPEAATYAHSLTREAPETARWWKLLGQVHLNRGHYEQALAALTIYGFLIPLNKEEQRLWADLNLQLDIPSRAAPCYAALLDGSADPHIVKNIVTAYRRMGEPGKALAQLDRYAAGNEDPELLMLRADLLYEMKQFGAAAKAYRLAADRHTTRSGQAWLMAGYAAWQDNDLAAGREAFEKAARFKPQRKTALVAMKQLQRIN